LSNKLPIMQIQSLERAIGILNLFRNSRRPLGISEMAEKLGLAKTTVHGLASTLEKNGFLLKDTASRKYRLGFALFELGSLQMADLEINQRVFQPLHRLADQYDRLCRAAIWDCGSILATMTAQPQGHETTSRQFGPRLPGYCRALGMEKGLRRFLDPKQALQRPRRTRPNWSGDMAEETKLLKWVQKAQHRPRGKTVNKSTGTGDAVYF
jgi:DNA-binding IclR family transcriptional regulator